MAVHFVEFVTFSLILMSSPRFGHANFNMNLPQSVIDFMNSGEANVWNFISGMMEYTQSKTIIIIIDTYSIGTIRKPLKSLLNPKTHQGIYFRSTVLHQDSAHLLQDPEIEHSLVLFLCSYRTVVNTMKWIMSSSEMLYKLSWITINNNKEWNTFELPEISPALKFFVVKFHYVKEHAEASAKVNRYEVTYLYNDFYMDRQRSSKIGDWSKATGLKTRKRFSDCCFNVSGYFVRVAFVSEILDNKLATLTRISNIDSINMDRIDFIGKIFTVVVETLKLRTEWYEVPDKTFGDYDPDKKTAYGLFHELQQQKADIAVETLTDTLRRRHVADFSVEIDQSSTGVIYSPPSYAEHFYFYLKPFTSNTWILVSCGSVSVLLAGTFLFRFSGRKNDKLNILNPWATFMNQGADLDNANFVLSFYQLMLYFTVGLLATFYSSKLIAMTAARFQPPPFTSMRELAEQDTYHPLFFYGSSIVQDIMISTDEEMIGIQKRLKDDYARYVWNMSLHDIGKTLAEEKVAFISSTQIIYDLKQNNEKLEIMDESYMKSGLHLAYRKEFPLRMIIDRMLLKLRTSGMVKRIRRQYFTEKKKTPENLRQIQLEEIYVPLFILFLGCFASSTLNAIGYLRRKR